MLVGTFIVYFVAASALTAAEISISPCLSELKYVFSDMIFYRIGSLFLWLQLLQIFYWIVPLHVDPQVVLQEIRLLTPQKGILKYV